LKLPKRLKTPTQKKLFFSKAKLTTTNENEARLITHPFRFVLLYDLEIVDQQKWLMFKNGSAKRSGGPKADQERLLTLKSLSEHALKFTSTAANINSILHKQQTDQITNACVVISEISCSCIEICDFIAENTTASDGLNEYLGLMALIKVFYS
jgi:hypothetical protein